ncbi:MAG: hypothetical protein K0Q94_447 [Paenibacillus sp.]|uniref:Helix-turn-helix domain-containing protein n=1 Tax=Paenibacillus hemerocallicola TaxID=1172614 RepID=A0A5C4T0C1_9BACL|nr:AraC family transcriptional regulator [Paenibacillus hemerocallicola]MDF2657656.1 hypothetical protein [Paenibacillus sp.]TNJ62230.1 helix-turn-helix domain-containing protein [Paenibacillus hemerocallicola]
MNLALEAWNACRLTEEKAYCADGFVFRQNHPAFPVWDTDVFPDPDTLMKIYKPTAVGVEFHAHTYLQLCYVNKGQCRHYMEQFASEAVKGDLLLIPPYIYHTFERINDRTEPELIQIDFMPSFINEHFDSLRYDSGLFDFAYIEPFVISANKLRPKLVLSDSVRQQLEALLQEMLLEQEKRKEGYKHLLKADLLRLLVIIGRQFSNSNYESDKDEKLLRKHKTAMLATIRYMDEHYADDLKLVEVCQYAMLSQTYFSHFLKYLTGKTFTEYINDRRINKSLEMLKNSDKNVADICFEVGFNEVTHFNRMFKKTMGLTPTAFRKREAAYRNP